MALNRRSSASPARAEAEGADSGKKPLRLSLLISRSIRRRSFAEEKPHQEGDVYISDAMVVALATSCNCHCLAFISSLQGAKVYSQTGWGPWPDFRPGSASCLFRLIYIHASGQPSNRAHIHGLIGTHTNLTHMCIYM